MDHRLKEPFRPQLPPRTEAQFLAQLPEFSEGLLELSQEYESSLLGLGRTLKTANLMRGWTVLEELARESLMERAKSAAVKKAQEDRARALHQAQSAKPTIPRRAIESALKSQAIKALDDPGVLDALKQWTQSRGTEKI